MHYTFEQLKIQMGESRKRTNAEIDILNQFLKEGEQPIPYELDENNNPIQQPTEEEKAAAQKIEDERILAEQQLNVDEAAKAQKILDDAAEAEKQRIIAEDKTKNIPPAKPETPAPTFELDDEKVLAYLKEKKGKEVTSLDDFLNPPKILTDEEKKAEAEQRESNKIAFGLNKGLFTKKQLEEFITDTTNPQALVYSLYTQQQKEKDPELSDEDIKAEFDEKFGLNEDKESRQYKVGQNLLNNLADNVIRKKHSVILNLDNEFTTHEKSQLQKQESEQKILKAAPLYKKDVEDVKGEIKNVTIQIDKDNSFIALIDDDVVNDVIAGMLDNKYSASQIESGWDKSKIKEVATATAILKSLPKILSDYADAQILAKQAGTRGIPPAGKTGARNTEPAELTESQKQALAFAFGEQAHVAN